MAGPGTADGERPVSDRDGGSEAGGDDDAGVDYSAQRVGIISAVAGGAVGEIVGE